MTTAPNLRLDLNALRTRLAVLRGPVYWRSLEELAETPEFQEFLHREFPENASELRDPVGRREFLKLMGASLALAGISGCGVAPPVEKIVPYVRPPEQIVPGKPLYFSTAMTLSGMATGVLVESHMGRPTKIEGNPDHPASLGASDIHAQASILTLYDPDRSQVVSNAGRITSYSAFLNAVTPAIARQRVSRGAGLRFLTETVTSPTLAWQLLALLKEFPEARWHQYEPCGQHAARAGAMLAFGEYVETRYHFDKADVVLSLDADFLCSGPGAIRYARQFMARRRVRSPNDRMNRLYVVESTPSNTGAVADHRLAVRARDMESFARAIARQLTKAGMAGPGTEPTVLAAHAKWVEGVVRDLERHRGACVVIAGAEQPPVVHWLVHAINHALGNVGTTVSYTDPVEARPEDQFQSLRELAADMRAGRVELLFILGGNPVYTAPVDLDFRGALGRVPFRMHLGLYDDETSAECHWQVNEAHYLETWSDARAFDGTATIQQPLIAPLYGGKSVHELLAAFTANPARPGYDIVREYWQTRFAARDFEKLWRRALHDGVVAGTALPPRKLTLKASLPPAPARSADAGIEIVFRPDPNLYDGRFANNGWLQELPRPLTKLVWDNAALVSARTAERLGLRNEELVELRYDGRNLHAPAWIVPGHADDSITLHFGFGRTRMGRVALGHGANAYALRTSGAPWFCAGVQVNPTGQKYALAVTQHHHSIDTSAVRHRVQEIVREARVQEFRANPELFRVGSDKPLPPLPNPPALTLYPERKYEGYAWGMAIDLTACTGCNACVVACQAENNIPIVGKDQVIRGREMHWLRIDRYYKGSLDAPDTVHQPVLCMHCENAPCEVVCPVAATVHSEEGLNDMVYNRCIGTRYCSNNCPYKVRRFNFFQYSDFHTPVLKLLRNPDVTVRSRGVMEKCTYCVQRINAARIEAEKEGRAIRDAEIVTACQAVCPSEAIVFGNINDPGSRVAKLKGTQLNYGLLTELNTRPRTTYLGRLRNPNPQLQSTTHDG
jgi:molybdopterin-containing oxidoreductase family iron-sulfur binding subunit